MASIDAMRGLVMVLMALDHAGAIFDAGHLFADSALMWTPGSPLPAAAFLTRFVTHLCAPTFVFLAGTAIALSRARRGVTDAAAERRADLFLVRRGLFIAALDPTAVSLTWFAMGGGATVLQVLYAIGASLVAMVLLRRLRDGVLVGLAVAFLAAYEPAVLATWAPDDWNAPVWAGLLITPAAWPAGGLNVTVIYPLLPWLAMMMLGWAFGRRVVALAADGRSPVPLLLAWGAGALALFAVVRGLDGYGNMQLHRDVPGVLGWLHVSKYPPSLSFAALTLGAMALVLAGLFAAERRRAAPLPPWRPLLLFGRTALFFYLLHVPVLELFGAVTGRIHGAGLPATYAAALAACVVLYPACRAWDRYKADHPQGWARYV